MGGREDFYRWPNMRSVVIGLIGFLSFGSALRCSAATANVSVGDNFFSPATTNINLNDTVTWTWIGFSSHSSTSSSGLWDSGIHGNGFTFSRQFTTAGNFPYFCRVHPFQTGSINVRSGDSAPTVMIVSPANGAVFAAPASFTFTANASDPDGSVTQVEFFRGTMSLGVDATSPYTMAVSGLPAGSYGLFAVATDNAGARATNSVSVEVVTPVPVALTQPERLSVTQFRFRYSANAGLRYVIERSANTDAWQAIATNTASQSTVIFVDTNATADLNLYRVGRLPNP